MNLSPQVWIIPRGRRKLILGHYREPQRLPLHLPCFLECRLVVHLPAAPQVDIPDLPAFSPGGHPVNIGLAPFLCGLLLLHLPEIDVFQPGSSLQGPRFGLQLIGLGFLALGPLSWHLAGSQTLSWLLVNISPAPWPQSSGLSSSLRQRSCAYNIIL